MSERRGNLIRQESARRLFLSRACVVEPGRRLRRLAVQERANQLGGAALKETGDELANVIDILDGVKDATLQEMVALFAHVMTEVYGGRLNSLLTALSVVETSTLVPILMRAYLGASVEETTAALETFLDGFSAYEIAVLTLPFLTKVFFDKLRIAKYFEAEERAARKKAAMELLHTFRAEHPNASQAMELEHLEQAAFVGRVEVSES